MNSAKKNVLIVDDSILILTRLKAMLKKLHNISAILVAEDYTNAIEILKKEEINIAILDINLRGESGIKLLQETKKHNVQIIVIMLTNQHNEQYAIISKKMGADHFLDKSKDFAQIPAIISSIA